jgi:hypothetical protein
MLNRQISLFDKALKLEQKVSDEKLPDHFLENKHPRVPEFMTFMIFRTPLETIFCPLSRILNKGNNFRNRGQSNLSRPIIILSFLIV